MAFDRHRIRSIRTEVDLPAIVMHDTQLICRARDHWRGCCPLHGGKHLNFAVYRSTKETDHPWKFRCFSKCQQRGDVLDYLQLAHHLTLREALERLHGAPRDRFMHQHSTAAGTKPESPPLSWRIVEPYARCVDLPIDPAGRDTQSALEWWKQQGLDEATIARFRLGFCPRCPTAWDPHHPNKRWPSATIPVWHTNGATGECVLDNVRHRLLFPPSQGDKYRPHATGLGVHLFNCDSLKRLPDGRTRQPEQSRILLLLEGEKKVMVTEALGLGWMYPMLADTGGAGSWLGAYGEVWSPLIETFDRKVVIRDPGMEEIAEQTAQRFGRHGYWLCLPQKLDDWLLTDPESRVDQFIGLVEDARQVRNRSYWSSEYRHPRWQEM